jgi:hypothetical protein
MGMVPGLAGINLSMEPVGELMRENPDLVNFAQEIMNNVLSKSTIQSYQGAIQKYQDFCNSVHHDRAEFSEKILLHYLTFLHKNNATGEAGNLVVAQHVLRGQVRVHRQGGQVDQCSETASS